jgi:hypothetical protein
MHELVDYGLVLEHLGPLLPAANLNAGEHSNLRGNIRVIVSVIAFITCAALNFEELGDAKPAGAQVHECGHRW